MRRARLLTGMVCLGTLASATVAATPADAVNAAQTTLVSPNPADFTPHVMNGSVDAITQIGSRIVAAGTFTRVRQTLNGPDIVRNHIFAFDATTGAIDTSFNPNLSGSANSLDTDGTYVYVGGSFTSVSGQSATKRVARLTATGTLVPGLPVPNKAVNEVVVRGGRLYLGGGFTRVGSTARASLAALDTSTGALLNAVNVGFAGTHNGGTTTIVRMDVSPDGSKLVAVGNFLTAGGQPRR